MEGVVEYINNSKYRAKIIKSMGDDAKFPSIISKETAIPQNQVSAVLKNFVDNDIAEIINPEARKGRCYRLTKYGLDVLELIK